MKKQIILISVLLMFLDLNGQTDTENYIHTINYQQAVQDNISSYPDYYQSISSSYFLLNSAGGGSAYISIENGTDLTFHIAGSWASTNGLKTGIITSVNTSTPLPDMELGTLTQTDGTLIEIAAKIESGNLVLYNVNVPSSIDCVSANLSGSIPDTSISFSSGTGYIHECQSGGSGGSSGTLSISNGTVSFIASGGWMPYVCNVRQGQILYIDVDPIPNMELGRFKDSNGDDTIFKVKIEDNWLVFYTDEPFVPQSLSCNYTTTQTIDGSPQMIEGITYFDGLGRPKQTIAKQAGGNGEDLITPVEYDVYGRQAKEYLPYSQNGNSALDYRNPIDSGLFSNIESQYLIKHSEDFDSSITPNPYAQTIFEPSPLNRVKENAAPGYDWRYDENNVSTTDVQIPVPFNFSATLDASLFPNYEGTPTEGQVNISINNTQVNMVFDMIMQQSEIKVGQIAYLDMAPYMLENCFVGQLSDENGVSIPYFVHVQNNYLVVTSNDPSYRTEGLNCTLSSVINIPPAEYTTYQIEESSNNTIRFNYKTNSYHDYVKRFGVSFPTNNTELPQLDDLGLYTPNTLYKTVIKDENWQPGQQYENDHTSEDYVDRFGRTVLKRVFDKGKWHDTYYVYDDFGNLTYVLPPKANTYVSILQQPWMGKSYVFEGQDADGIFASQMEYVELSFYFSPNGYLYVDILGVGDEIELEDGMVFDLGFIDPPLPDMEIGELEYDNGAYAGDLYINSGNLYIDASGMGFEYFENSFSVPLTNYENSFSAPPFDQGQLDELCYQYRYDHRNRLVEKRIPGKEDWEYIVYDKQDRPVGTQDPNLRAQDKWLFTKYDAFGRTAYTGIKNIVWTRAQTQGTVDGFGTNNTSRDNSGFTMNGLNVKYTTGGWPTSFNEVLTVNYYDDYDVGLDADLNYQDSYGQQLSTNNKTLGTVSEVRVLGTDDWITSATYYDHKARPIFTAVKNSYLNTYDWTKTKLDFVGNIMESENFHQKNNGSPVITTDKFTYDHQNRLLSQTQTINNGIPELIANNHYDELGHLEKKNVGGSVSPIPEESPGLQTVDYGYNIRGWLKTINDPYNIGEDLFSFSISYQDPQGPTSSTTYNTPLYNGNISHTLWKTDNVDGGLRHYMYRYDALNRFDKGYFALNDKLNYKYNAYVYGYDRNGNIDRLFRYGANPSNPSSATGIDNLYYSYQGNKLTGVKDTYGLTVNGVEGFKDGNTIGNDYDYDDNGNMTLDKNKGITSIEYNHLNLPTFIEVAVENGDNGNISYIYDATGSKLKKVYIDEDNQTTTATIYAGNFVYEKVDSNPEELKFFNHPEGYVEPLGGYNYVYQYKDHLGNIRLSYQDMDHDGQVTGATTEVFFDDLENSSGWDSVGALYGISATLDGEHALSGGYATKLVLENANTSKYAHSNTWIPINNPQPTDYIFSGWFYSEGPRARLVFFMNEDNETSYFTIVEPSDVSAITGKWVYLEKRVTVPPNIDKINLRIGAFYGNAGGIWYDNLSIRRANSDNDIEIVEENNYYPFGLRHKGYNSVVNGTHHPYRFGGNEYDKSLGIDSYDFGSRNYDPALGRWFDIDPFAELMRNQSPYNFGFNNPIYFSDYAGTIPWPLPECWKIWSRKSTPDEYFGYIKRRKRDHNGLDLNYSGGGNTDYGAPVVATHSGKVARIIPLSANDGGGRVIVIESPDGSFQTKYMHLSSVAVEAGQEISEGQTIGLMGGSAFGKDKGRTAHLHYEIHRRNSNGSYSAVNPWNGSQPVDPQSWIEPDPIDFYNEFDFQMALFDYENNEARTKEASQPAQSESESSSGGSRTPATPLPSITPAPIVPIPTPLPSGGTINPTPSPAPAPAPLPIIPPEPCIDC